MSFTQTDLFDETTLPQLPEVDQSIMVALENMAIIQNGLSSCTEEELKQPEVLEQFQRRMNDIGEVTGLAVPVINEETVVSTEGIVMSIIATTLRKIAEFFRNVGKWIWNMLTNTKTTAKVQEAAVKTTATQAQKKAESLANSKDDTSMTSNKYIRIELPARSYCMFHTAKSIPQTGFNYNAESLKKSTEEIQSNYATFTAAVREQINNLLETTDRLMLRLEELPGQMPYREIQQMRHQGKLYSLAHANYSMIGFKTIEKPMSQVNEFRKTKVDLTNMVNELGWDSNTGYTFSFHVTEVKQISKTITDQVTTVNKEVNGLIDKLNQSKIIKRLEQYKTPTVLTGDDEIFASANNSGTMSDAHRQNIMHRLNVAYELAISVQILIHTYAGFSQRYTAQLTALMGAVNKALD